MFLYAAEQKTFTRKGLAFGWVGFEYSTRVAIDFPLIPSAFGGAACETVRREFVKHQFADSALKLQP